MTTVDMNIKAEQQETTSWMPWVICITGALFFFYEFVQLNMLNSLNEDLMRTFNIDATQVSLLSATYFLANIIFLIPAGLLLDRISTRKVILSSLAICVLGTATFALSNSFTLAIVCRFLTGIGSAFCFLSSIRLASRWFPANRMALISGFIVTMGMLGGWVAQSPLTLLIEHLGWRNAVLLDACLGAMIFILIATIVKDYPAHKTEYVKTHRQYLSAMGFWRSLGHSYLNRQNWLSGIYTSMMNLPIFILGALWGIPYLEQMKHLNRDQASFVTGMIFFGTVIGSPLAGFISDKLGRRKIPMLAGAIIALILILLLMYYPNMGLTSLIWIFLALGAITSTQVISYPTVNESNPPSLTATSISVISLCSISAGALFQPIYGWLMDLSWNHKVINHITIYSNSDYHRAMLLLPAAIVVALIAGILLKETYCKRIET